MSFFNWFWAWCLFSQMIVASVAHDWRYSCSDKGIISPFPFTRAELLDHLRDFVPFYAERPVYARRVGGMRFDHSFAVYCIVKRMQPKYIVESGAYFGWSTFLLRHSAPSATIISLDPFYRSKYAPGHNSNKTVYLYGTNFLDFAKVDWNRFIPVHDRCDNTLVFFDDHQSAIVRTAEAQSRHFCNLLFDDNFPPPLGVGDNFSWKQACAVGEDANARHFVTNFGRGTWSQPGVILRTIWEQIPLVVTQYYEFPPIAAQSLTHQTRYKPEYAPPPIIANKSEWIQYRLDREPKIWYDSYVHLCFIRVRPSPRLLPVQ